MHLYLNTIEKSKYLDITPHVDNVHLYHFKKIKYISFTFPIFKSLVNLVISFINIINLINIFKKMAKDIDEGNFDYSFIHQNKDYVQSPFLIKFLKTKSIFFCAEPMRIFYDKELFKELRHKKIKENLYSRITHSFDQIIKKILLNKIQKFDIQNIKACDLVLTNSYFSKENILSAYGIESKVVHLGGDIFDKDEKIKKPTEINQVLSLGSINSIKGYEFIINSISLIKEDFRPKLLIIGNSADKLFLEKIKNLSKLKQVNLEIKINISDLDLKNAFLESSIFAYASFLEPLGLAPLEAMSFGLPVVAIKEGGLRETVIDGYNGFLVDRSPEHFSRKILNLILDNSLYKKMSYNCKNHVRDYWNWDFAYNRLIKAIG